MKKALLFLGMFISMLSVCAEDNVLQSIEIIPVKDTYNIVLVADKAVDVKKTVKAPNQVTLNLKDIRASKSLNTIYNNVSNVDTVMVEPQGNGVSIFFQAENAAGTSVSFDSLASLMPRKPESQKLKLNSPIESYAPIYREEVQTQKTSDLYNRIKKSNAVANVKESIDTTAIADSLNKVFSFGLIGLLIFAIFRLFRRKESEMKIGLSQSLKDREIEMYRGAQQPLNNSYMTSEKPYTTVNYGINAYQRENRNPYENEAPMTIHNPRLRNYASQRSYSNVTSQPVAQQTVAPAQTNISTQTLAKPMLKPNTTQVNSSVSVNQNNPNIDNLKFLESMTAIYEKSGRHDLARGLKASLNRNNIKA